MLLSKRIELELGFTNVKFQMEEPLFIYFDAIDEDGNEVEVKYIKDIDDFEFRPCGTEDWLIG